MSIPSLDDPTLSLTESLRSHWGTQSCSTTVYACPNFSSHLAMSQGEKVPLQPFLCYLLLVPSSPSLQLSLLQHHHPLPPHWITPLSSHICSAVPLIPRPSLGPAHITPNQWKESSAHTASTSPLLILSSSTLTHPGRIGHGHLPPPCCLSQRAPFCLPPDSWPLWILHQTVILIFPLPHTKPFFSFLFYFLTFLKLKYSWFTVFQIYSCCCC